MAKFKRLSRFLERIGIKKKQQKEFVDLASRSRSSRRFWPRKSESGTRPQTTGTSNAGRGSSFGRLFRLLKFKRAKSSPTNVGGGDKDDVAEDLATGKYPDVTEDSNLVGLPTLSISSINTVSADGADQLSIDREMSCQWGPRLTTVLGTNSISDLTSLTELSNYYCNKRDLEVYSKLSVSCRENFSTSFTDLTSVTELSDDIEASNVSSELSSIMSLELLMETEGEGVEEGYENTLQLEDNNCGEVVEWVQPQSGCGHKEAVDEAEGEQSNSVDDMIVLFLPAIITVVATVFIYLLTLIC